MHNPRSSTIPGLAPPPPLPSRVAALHRQLLLDVVHHGPAWDRASRREWLCHVLTPALAGASSGGALPSFVEETWTHALSTLRSRLDELVAHRDGFVHAAVYRGLLVREAGDWNIDATKVMDLATALTSLLARDVLRRRATYDDELTFCQACQCYRFVHWEQRPSRPCPCRRRVWATSR